MTPAPSLILFTVLSGLGLGMVAWLGFGFGPDGPFAIAAPLVALVLTGAGGLASTAHLARPDRAWRAFSQWRSSWLSREACLLVATVAVFVLYAGLWALAGTRIAPLGWLAAGLALATVHATAMIYAQLRTVPRWSVPPTPALFVALALAGGLLAHQSVAALAGGGTALWLALPVLALAAGVAVWWQTAAAGARMWVEGTTLTTATGLGARGRVRAFEPPHTGPNYLLEEMAFRVGRRRAFELRRLAALLGFALPLLLAALGTVLGGWLALPALLSHALGVAALRWLFFAEAEHVQALYYGTRGEADAA
jgi:DMSO reductase anchor subunit